MSKPSLLLIGAGGHALSCIDVIEQQGSYAIAGLIGLPHEVGSQRLGYPVLATDAELPELAGKYRFALVTLGQIRTPELRIQMYARLCQLGFQLPAVVSPNAQVSTHAVVGAGSIVMHGVIINAAACIGNNCIINTMALIEHGVRIGDHCHIATGTLVNGDVTVGAGTFIGSGTVVREGVTIGANSLIGMGQSVNGNFPAASQRDD